MVGASFVRRRQDCDEMRSPTNHPAVLTWTPTVPDADGESGITMADLVTFGTG